MRPCLGWAFVLFLASAVQAAQTNGMGGGPWDRPATWEGGKRPAAAEPATVREGDTLLISGTGEARCGPMAIESGGRVCLEAGGGRLTCAGDLTVKGALSLGPGSELAIDCPASMQFGVFVMPEGSLHARGSHGFDRNCRIRAARADGKHNTFINFERDARGSLRFCDLSYLGGTPFKGSRHTHRSGIFFVNQVQVEGCHLHHCDTAIHLITGGDITIRHNLFTENDMGLLLYRPTGPLVTGNHFAQNKVGLSVTGKHTEASCRIRGNLFERNQVGASPQGMLAPTQLSENLYVNNDVALRLASANVCVAQERLLGNKCAAEVASGIVGARLLHCDFGEPKAGAGQVDVRVASPGPAGLVLEGCRLSQAEPVTFVPDAPDKPTGPRWVISRGPEGAAGRERRWDAPQATPATPGGKGK